MKLTWKFIPEKGFSNKEVGSRGRRLIAKKKRRLIAKKKKLIAKKNDD